MPRRKKRDYCHENGELGLVSFVQDGVLVAGQETRVRRCLLIGPEDRALGILFLDQRPPTLPSRFPQVLG